MHWASISSPARFRPCAPTVTPSPEPSLTGGWCSPGSPGSSRWPRYGCCATGPGPAHGDGDDADPRPGSQAEAVPSSGRRGAAVTGAGDGEAVQVSGTCDGLEVFEIHGLPTGGAGRDRGGDLATAGVPHEDRRAVGRGVLVPPLPHAGQHRPQITALAGEPVVVALRVLAVGHFHQDAGFHQPG